MLGTLHRLRTTSATKAATIADACDMYICFASLGYSVRTFTTALDKIAISTQEKHWRRIAKLILRTQPTLFHSGGPLYNHTTHDTHLSPHPQQLCPNERSPTQD